MRFNQSTPIYLQIADLIIDKIANEEQCRADRIPSVRELGVELEVNPNTIMRAYEWLSEKEIIYTLRGRGYFVSDTALATIKKSRKQQLFDQDLRNIAIRMQQLEISIDEVVEYLQKNISTTPKK